jgi:cell division septation protein DedD
MRKPILDPNEGSHRKALRSRFARAFPPNGEVPEYLSRIAELRERLPAKPSPSISVDSIQGERTAWFRKPRTISTVRWAVVTTIGILAIAMGLNHAMVRPQRNRGPESLRNPPSRTQTVSQVSTQNTKVDISDAADSQFSKPPSGFHVQIGAFNVLENARELVRTLDSRGYSSRVVELNERPRYRVWAGDFPDRSSAERLAARLRATGLEASVVSR